MFTTKDKIPNLKKQKLNSKHISRLVCSKIVFLSLFRKFRILIRIVSYLKVQGFRVSELLLQIESPRCG